MRLVDEEQKVFGEVVEQRRRRLARRAARQVARVVLDPVAVAHLLEHLEVEEGALLEPLGLDQLVRGLQLEQPLAQLALIASSPWSGGRRGHVVRAREDRHLVDLAHHLAAQRVDSEIPSISSPKSSMRTAFSFVGREDLDGVAAHAKGAARKVDVVALVLNLDQPAQQRVAPHLDPRVRRASSPVRIGEPMP